MQCVPKLLLYELVFSVISMVHRGVAQPLSPQGCFVKEMNRSAKRSEDVTDLPLTGPSVAPKTRFALGSMNFQSGQILPEPQINGDVEDTYLP